MNQGKCDGGKITSHNMYYLIIWRKNLNNSRLIISATKEMTNVNNK